MGLYPYNSRIRKLIWRAKISNNLGAVLAVEQLFLSCQAVKQAGVWTDLILPAPSSLWGRIRGRYDLAYFLASALADKLGRPLAHLPMSYYLNLRKQALRSRKARGRWKMDGSTESGEFSNSNTHDSLFSHEVERILIVDDIVTTGRTFKTIAQKLGERELKFVAFADARYGIDN